MNCSVPADSLGCSCPGRMQAIQVAVGTTDDDVDAPVAVGVTDDWSARRGRKALPPEALTRIGRAAANRDQTAIVGPEQELMPSVAVQIGGNAAWRAGTEGERPFELSRRQIVA